MDHHQIDRIAEDLLAIVPQLHRMLSSDIRRDDDTQASMIQWRLLAALTHDPQSMSALARQQHVSPQAICDLVHDMVERGWLRRLPHPNDRRQHLLTITEPGRATLNEARARIVRHLAPRLRTLGDAELHILAAALPTLQRVLSYGDQQRKPEDEPLE